MELGQVPAAPGPYRPVLGNRYMRLRAEPGALRLRYSATVELKHHVAALELDPRGAGGPPAGRRADLSVSEPLLSVRSPLRRGDARVRPPAAGYGRVPPICGGSACVEFKSATTNASTSAVDTLTERVGVCRDFAHLMIALCRAPQHWPVSPPASTSAPTRPSAE